MNSCESSVEANASCQEPVAKSKNQLKNEAKKAEKLAKYEAKLAKVGNLEEKAKPKKSLANIMTTNEIDVPGIVTKEGDKKDMSQPMASAYLPSAVEKSWYSWWEKSGFFKPEYSPSDDPKNRFVMILPPPNVTGSLHVGHAMMGSVEDAIARWHRMHGKEVLYLPGCDHAGIATQAVVEKKLMKERKLTRHDLGREAFLKEVWNYKNQYGDQIYQQLKRLGISLDWSRACFTLDPSANRAVNEAFIRMFEDGLIFRSNRLVNWSGKLQTALSDLEVDMIEIAPNSWLEVKGHKKTKYEFGVMTSIAYPLEDESGEIIIATTRPETVFADTALAVNSNDQRYFKHHGKKVIHPVTGKKIPIILDEAADPLFGTGALKISPGHDHTDFIIGQRHSLEFISVFNEHNCLNQNAGPLFSGLARYDAREAVIEFIKKNGTFRGQTPHAMSLPVCSRSGDFVEPRMMPQWWCKCSEMAKSALNVSQDGSLEIIPDEYKKIWANWLENIHDWCLSRQLWWGHRIPAFKVISPDIEDESWVVGRDEKEALGNALKKFPHLSRENVKLEQDHDVLDTWFSSGLWPFSTLGWPDQTPDFERFFPNTLLETGGDILFFWVARMVMMSIYLTGKVPFSTVFLHAIVRDAQGRKMSKSLGNVIDPIDVIQGQSLDALHKSLERGNLDSKEVERAKANQKLEYPNGIPECGADALRFALCSYVAHGRDVNLSISKVESIRKFCNKIWNACKFALTKLGNEFEPGNSFTLTGKESAADRWILKKLNVAITSTNASFEAYNLMQATGSIYSFWLYDLCDVYIEAIKPIIQKDTDEAKISKIVLHYCIEQGLLLLHPFMPFITEELYQRLPKGKDVSVPSICVSRFPQANDNFEKLDEDEFSKIFEAVKEVRSLAAEAKIPKGSFINLTPTSQSSRKLIDSHHEAFASLVKAVGNLKISENCGEGELLLSTLEASLQFEQKLC